VRRAYCALLIVWGLCLVLAYSVEGSAAALGTSGIESHPTSFSPDGLQVSFRSNIEGHYDDYSVRRGGGKPHRLLHITDNEYRIPSPDGRRTAVLRSIDPELGSRPWDFTLLVEDADGSRRTIAVPDPAAPAWSRDGSRLAVLSCTSIYAGAGCEVFLVDPASGQARRASVGIAAYLVVWSPDGRWLATYGRDAITLYDISADKDRAYAPADNLDDIVWSPDSTRVAYDSDDVGAGRMYVLSTNGSKAVRFPDADRPLAWSPDGSRLAYDHSGLFSVAADGTDVRKMLPGHPDLVLSADWRWVAFSERSYEGYDVYVQQLGHAPRLLTPSQCTVTGDVRIRLVGCRQGSDHRDRLVGGPKRNIFLAGAGDDVVLGRGGNDRIEGSLGKDRLVGATGQNVIFGGFGDDVLFGGPEADWLRGDEGHDRVYGGDGPDRIGADEGDRIDAGAGNDAVFARTNVARRVRDVVDCGPGLDRAVVDPIDIVRNCERVSYS
jgi:hypothetical protein